jgi:hypothetical protein
MDAASRAASGPGAWSGRHCSRQNSRSSASLRSCLPRRCCQRESHRPGGGASRPGRPSESRRRSRSRTGKKPRGRGRDGRVRSEAPARLPRSDHGSPGRMASNLPQCLQVGHELSCRERALTRRTAAAPLVVAVHEEPVIKEPGKGAQVVPQARAPVAQHQRIAGTCRRQPQHRAIRHRHSLCGHGHAVCHRELDESSRADHCAGATPAAAPVSGPDVLDPSLIARAACGSL